MDRTLIRLILSVQHLRISTSRTPNRAAEQAPHQSYPTCWTNSPTPRFPSTPHPHDAFTTPPKALRALASRPRLAKDDHGQIALRPTNGTISAGEYHVFPEKF